MRKTRLTVAALALALPLSLAACGSDDTATSGSGTSSSAAATSAAPSASPSDSATTASAPFGSACSAVPADGAGSFDGMAQDPVATAASNNPVLSTLVTAVGEAGLGDTLNSAKDITVFAPTNDAFEALPKATLDAAMKDPKGLLTTVLTNHVVEGRLSPDQVAGEHKTLSGKSITVEGSGEDFTVTPGDAKIVCGNVQTANATVYIIDKVLVPES
ncbi:fasciclin domain-containing protein [Arthrobacter sp. NEB 688]|uniref:fasciclin domain-containing protein n=1 Tax=Arthrobacter sp. NEB 688 TaxID=904039 RepID=UPI0015635875|nr:fasciclin domain-containing protein [Arthrobacter sp. NEB 688]QKE83528.1 fasciclin domain-containing protein [Arthrobacter sp. NEB 688]